MDSKRKDTQHALPYGLSYSRSEVRPLKRQVTFFRDLTEDVLQQAGVERGMRVLDFGCSTGDTSLLIAKLVGPSGLVVAVDGSAQAIDLAQRRATVAGQCYWTRFVAADLDTFVTDEIFDAIVVRPMLLREPAAALRKLSDQICPGGLITLQEMSTPMATICAEFAAYKPAGHILGASPELAPSALGQPNM